MNLYFKSEYLITRHKKQGIQHAIVNKPTETEIELSNGVASQFMELIYLLKRRYNSFYLMYVFSVLGYMFEEGGCS